MTSRRTKTARRQHLADRRCTLCGVSALRARWGRGSRHCRECEQSRQLLQPGDQIAAERWRDRTVSGLLGVRGVLPGAGALPAFRYAEQLGETATGRRWGHVDVDLLRRQATARWPTVFTDRRDQPSC